MTGALVLAVAVLVAAVAAVLRRRFDGRAFSSAFCQPCRIARRLLTDVARAVPGVPRPDQLLAAVAEVVA